VLVTVAPGADMALVTGQVLVGGTWLAQRTILGNLSGLVVPRCRPRRRAVGTAGVGGRLHRGEAGRRRLPALLLGRILRWLVCSAASRNPPDP
jgi:hypothetical protein